MGSLGISTTIIPSQKNNINNNNNNNISRQVVLSKLATNEGHGENTPYFEGWKAYDRDPFHPLNNLNGVIQMGLAENQLCFDMIEDWVRKNPEASICTAEGVKEFKDVAIFQDYNGFPEFRMAIAKFMSKVRGERVRFEPNRIVMGGGATGANELLVFCLANPGDAFLVPTPYYPAFVRDLCWRTGARIIPVPCESSNNFEITKLALESAYEEAKNDNINVKGLIITNPSNPLGTALDKRTLKMLLRFTNDNNLHLVCDEIYAATVTDPSAYVSVAEVIEDVDMRDIDRDLVHIVYSLSKDMGLPGFRVGVVYSYNDTVVEIGRKMSSFGLVSSQTQRHLAAMLGDDTFVSRFLAESRRRLLERRRRFVEGLAEVGIGSLEGNAGLFFWMDLRRLLKDATFEAEMALWRVVVNEVKLNVSPGSSFHCEEPGWFRVCFANMNDDTVDVALGRIKSFVAGKSRASVKARRSSWTKNSNANLRLSFKKQEGNNGFVSSMIMSMSPHSPMPQSPLVRAHT